MPAAEPAAREIGGELFEAALRIEPRVWVRHRVDRDRPAPERLDLESRASQQIPVLLHRFELARCQVQGQRQQQTLRGHPGAGELRHGALVENSFMGRMLVHDRDTFGRFEQEIGGKDLQDRARGRPGRVGQGRVSVLEQ